MVDGPRTITVTMVRHGQTLANKRGIVQSSKGGGGGGLTMAGAKQIAATGRTLAGMTQSQGFDLVLVSDCKRTLHTAELLLGALPSAVQRLGSAARPADDSTRRFGAPPFVVLEPLARERHPGRYEGGTSEAFATAARNAVRAEAKAKAKARAQSLKAKGKVVQSRRKVAAAAEAAMQEPAEAATVEGEGPGEAAAASRSWRPDGGGESWSDVCERCADLLKRIVLLVERSDGAVEAAGGAQQPKGHRAHVLVVTHGGVIKEFINAQEEGWRAPHAGTAATAAAAAAATAPARRKIYPNNARNGAIFQFSVELGAAQATKLRKAARDFAHAKASGVAARSGGKDGDTAKVAAAAARRAARVALSQAVNEAVAASRTHMVRENEASAATDCSAQDNEAAVTLSLLGEQWAAHQSQLATHPQHPGNGTSDSDGESSAAGPMSAKALRRSMRNSRRQQQQQQQQPQTRVEVVKGVPLCGQSIGEKLQFRAELMSDASTAAFNKGQAGRALGTAGGGSDIVVVSGKRGGWHFIKQLRNRDPATVALFILVVGAALAVVALSQQG